MSTQAKPAKRPLFPSELDASQRVMFLALARSDMDMAAEACELGVRHAKKTGKPSSEYLVYSESAIVRYARPFCASRVGMEGSKKEVKAALGDGYIARDVHPHAHELHQQAMDLRSSIVAHSDMRNRNFVLERLEKTDKNTSRWDVRSMYVFFVPAQLHYLGKMARVIQRRIMAELDDAADAAFPHIQLGQTLQVGFGNPAQIEHIQKEWWNTQPVVVETMRHPSPGRPSK